MRLRSRLPGKSVCLSLSFRSGSKAPSRPSCAARGTSRRSADATGRSGICCPERRVRRGAMASTTFDLNDLKRRMQGAVQSLKQELAGLRTGRASTALLEHVQVEAYGSHMPLNQLATISVPEPRLLHVQVWDRSMVHPIEKAISAANLGLTPS